MNLTCFQAALHFSTNTYEEFCRLINVDREEWNDLLKLLDQTSLKTLRFVDYLAMCLVVHWRAV